MRTTFIFGKFFHYLFLFLLTSIVGVYGSNQSDLAEIQKQIEHESAIMKKDPSIAPSPKLKELQKRAIQIQRRSTSEAVKKLDSASKKENSNIAAKVVEYKDNIQSAADGAISVMDALHTELGIESKKLKSKIERITDHRNVSEFLSKVGSSSKDAKRVQKLNQKLQQLNQHQSKIERDRKRLQSAKSSLKKGKTALDALSVANDFKDGKYLEGTEGALNIIKDYLPDHSGKIKALDATTKLLAETSGGTKRVNKKLGKEMARLSEYSNKLKRVEKLSKGIDASLKTIGYIKQAKDLLNKAADYQKKFQALKDDGTTTKAGRNLIMGMDAVGEGIKKLAGYLPSGASDFVEFYGDAMKLPGTVNKVAKKWYKDRDEAVNITGPLAQTKAGREYPGILDRDPELNPDGNLGVYYDPEKGRYVLITDPDEPAIFISEKERNKIAQIRSDLSATGKKLTNSMIEELRKNGYKKIVIPGTFSDEVIDVKDLEKLADKKREEARIKMLASEALGVKNPSKKDLADYRRFDDKLNFTQRLYNFHLTDEQKKRLFAKFQDDPKGFEDFLNSYAKRKKGTGSVPRLTDEQKKQKEAQDRAKKLGIHQEDLIPYFDCLCRNCGGSLGGNYNPGFKGGGQGPCQCNGPLTIWKTGMATSKESEIACFNSITQMNYNKNKAIFDKWHRAALRENAKSVQKELQKVKQLSQKEETLVEAAELFERIKALLDKQARGAVSGDLWSALISSANVKVGYGDLKGAIYREELSSKVRDLDSTKNPILAHYKKWEKTWSEAKSKLFPKIDSNISKGNHITAKRMLEDLTRAMLPQLGANKYPYAHLDPKYVSLKERFEKKEKEYYQVYNDSYHKIQKFKKEKDPKSALKLTEELLKNWQHDAQRKSNMQRDVIQFNKLIKLALQNAKTGDMYKKQKNYTNAVKHYQASLFYQKDSLVKRKLDELLNRHKKAMKYKKSGDDYLKKQKLSHAINRYKSSIRQWPDSNLKNLIRKLENQLKNQKKAAKIKAKMAKLEKERRAAQRREAADEGFDFGSRFGQRESGRSQQVQERQTRDSYADNQVTEDKFKKMMGKLKQDLKKYGTQSAHIEPIADTPLPQGHSSLPTSSSHNSTGSTQGNKIFTTDNIDGVQNGPTKPSTFTLKSTCKILSITNYHWNGGKGAKPGTIAVQASNGKRYGPWIPVKVNPNGSDPKLYWRVTPNITLPAGSYTVIDSDNATWAHNAQSGNRGMTNVYSDCGSSTVTPTPTSTATPDISKQQPKFAGVLSGTWQGKSSCCSVSGTFKMRVLSSGSVIISYYGDDEGEIRGSIGKTGGINVKKAGGSHGVFKWSGTIKKGSNNGLEGHGVWGDDEYRGTWKSGSGKVKKSTATSSKHLDWDGTYVGYYEDKKHSNCVNPKGNMTLKIHGNSFSGDGSGTIDEKGDLHGSFNNGYRAGGRIKLNTLIQGYISGPKGCFSYLELRKKK